MFDHVGSLLLLGLFSSCGKWTSRCGGFSCWGAQALVQVGFSSCSMWAQQLWLSGSTAQAQ